jgi:hypothetical protein
MKFNPDTVSQPVTGAEARRLNAALKKGTYLANAAALTTIERSVRAHKAAPAPRASEA